VARGWRRLHNEELHKLYGPPNIFRVIKWWRMRWAGHVAHMGEMYTVFWLEIIKGRHKLDGRIILEWIIGKEGVKVWSGLIWLRIGTSGGLLWTRWWTFGFHKRRWMP
jgi:hypothetical protein